MLNVQIFYKKNATKRKVCTLLTFLRKSYVAFSVAFKLKTFCLEWVWMGGVDCRGGILRGRGVYIYMYIYTMIPLMMN